MVVIGLTGSLGTGKSTVAEIFGRLGAKILSADKMAHAAISSNGECFKPVVRLFGNDILTRGRINRKKLAAIVFANSRQLKQLTAVIHPTVYRRINNDIKKNRRSKRCRVMVLEVPLLFEAGFDKLADYTVVVKTKRTTQINRAMRRLRITQKEALRRIKQQMPLHEKIKRGNYIINNEGSKENTRKQVKQIWNKLLTECK